MPKCRLNPTKPSWPAVSQDAATEFPVFLALCLGLESDDSCKLYGITFRFCGSRVLDLDVEFKGFGA